MKRRKKNRTPSSRTTQARQTAFLEAYRKTGILTAAAEISEVGRRTHYDWLDKSPSYRKRFDEADAEAKDRLEMEARRRAVEGWDEPVFYKGQMAGVWVDADGKPAENPEDAVRFQPHGIRKYSDQLLVLMLKGSHPEKYRERVEHTGKDGSPLTQVIRVYVPDNRRGDRQTGAPAGD